MAPVSTASPGAAYNKIGYWSPNTASVDWCESNYAVSFYIADLFPTNEKRFKILFLICGIVTIGSMLFHGTLRHKMQLLDELPMLYSSTIVMFILVEAKHGRQGSWFPTLLVIWITVASIVFSTTGGKIQFYTFQSTYTILQFCMIYYLRVLHVQQCSKQPNPAISTMIHRALGFGALAVTIWLIDLRLCEFVNGVGPKSILRWNPQLHAWWHIFSAIAMYHVSILVSYYHYDVLARQPMIYHWNGIVPALRFAQPCSQDRKKTH
ncbi:Alkaline ceramidase 3 [Mortierella polycephala]|uniref:Alkaline ceramidase 3 n=1 Tax=Mortierella polycephala TaxID=41804 RepID=A0A9P6PS08_9FUNG|nr:Alkaline ceramidase 3 [Mortierella polycephala]